MKRSKINSKFINWSTIVETNIIPVTAHAEVKGYKSKKTSVINIANDSNVEVSKKMTYD